MDDPDDFEWDPSGQYDYCNPSANSTSAGAPSNVQPCHSYPERLDDSIGRVEEDPYAADNQPRTIFADLWAPFASLDSIQFRVAFPVMVEFSIAELPPTTHAEVIGVVRAVLIREGISEPVITTALSEEHPNRLALTVASSLWPRAAAVLSGAGQTVPFRGWTFSIALPPGMYVVPPVASPVAQPPTTSRPTTAQPTERRPPPVSPSAAPTHAAQSHGDQKGKLVVEKSYANVLGICVGAVVVLMAIAAYVVQKRLIASDFDATSELDATSESGRMGFGRHSYRSRLTSTSTDNTSYFAERARTVSSTSTSSRLTVRKVTARKRSRIHLDLTMASSETATDHDPETTVPLHERRLHTDVDNSMEWDPELQFFHK